MKAMIIRHLDLTTTSVGALRDLIHKSAKSPGLLLHAHFIDIASDSSFKIYKPIISKLDTLKIYTHAHGSKTMNLIINMDKDDIQILRNDNALLVDVDIQHETELSMFSFQDYQAYKANPENKWD